MWYLVEKSHVDVNQRDVDPEYTRPIASGTPLIYAARAHAVKGDGNGGWVLWYLLEHGAGSYRMDCYNGVDAFSRARGNHTALWVLEKWEVSRGLYDDCKR